MPMVFFLFLLWAAGLAASMPALRAGRRREGKGRIPEGHEIVLLRAGRPDRPSALARADGQQENFGKPEFFPLALRSKKEVGDLAAADGALLRAARRPGRLLPARKETSWRHGRRNGSP